MKTGVVMHYNDRFEQEARWCVEHGIGTCQLGIRPDMLTDETRSQVARVTNATGMRITALVGAWSGPAEWNFTQGPQTLGIVPVAHRERRVQELIACARFAAALGVARVCTHFGFIPENACDPLYGGFIEAARALAERCRELGVGIDMETGQETPIAMLRAIHGIGLDNVGVNFDPANLLMYGKANPLDALDILGPYVKGVHAKDGEYPTNPSHLGREMPMGKGKVDIPAFISKLKQIGYDGAITIEREIEGDEQKADILAANGMIAGLI